MPRVAHTAGSQHHANSADEGGGTVRLGWLLASAQVRYDSDCTPRYPQAPDRRGLSRSDTRRKRTRYRRRRGSVGQPGASSPSLKPCRPAPALRSSGVALVADRRSCGNVRTRADLAMPVRTAFNKAEIPSATVADATRPWRWRKARCTLHIPAARPLSPSSGRSESPGVTAGYVPAR